MKIELSPAVELALRKAAAAAQHAGRAEFGTTDLLCALLDEEEGQAAMLVREAGAEWDKLRRLFPACAHTGDGPVDFPHSREVASAMAQARELARLHGAEGTIASDHLVLASLDVDSACRSLAEGIGLNFATLKERIAPTLPALHFDQPFDLAPATEAIDTARILDAGANRAREALRVLEDYARFVCADALLSSRLKNLRHQLAVALESLPEGLLLQARDTVHDVGTTISTARELERSSPRAVVVANAKRLAEALRSLEEYGKVFGADFGQAVEALRYESYTLERVLIGGGARTNRLAGANLYVLATEALCRHSLFGTVQEALAGGAHVIQLREKEMGDRALLASARQIAQMTRTANALFIVNDRPDIALLADADGVHLGQDDMPVHEARRILGPDALIGVSTHDVEQLRTAVLQGADYLGIGPTFPSQTKEFADLAGLEFVRQAAKETSLPAFALGGVTAENVASVLAAGGRRVAVSRAICGAEDPRRAAEKIVSALATPLPHAP